MRSVALLTAVTAVIVTILLLSIAGGMATHDGARPTIYVDDDGTQPYLRIKNAVYFAKDGDTVFVYEGTYSDEYIQINKSIQLIGENKFSTIIKGQITITADNVTISNFTIKGTDRHPLYDFYIDNGLILHSNGNVVTDCIVKQNNGGIEIFDASHNIIKNCLIRDNSCGISVSGTSEGNIIYHNNFINNKQKTLYSDISIPRNAYIESCQYPQQWNSSIEGNYWDDYDGPDADRDGIGEIPYPLGGGCGDKDYYPLFSPLDLGSPKGDTDTGSATTPGFEGVIILLSLAIIFAIKRKLKK